MKKQNNYSSPVILIDRFAQMSVLCTSSAVDGLEIISGQNVIDQSQGFDL